MDDRGEARAPEQFADRQPVLAVGRWVGEVDRESAGEVGVVRRVVAGGEVEEPERPLHGRAGD